jgi:hypothetical protein
MDSDRIATVGVPHGAGCLTLLIARLALLLVMTAAPACSQMENARRPPTTVVVFADRAMADRQWDALFAALRSGLAGDEMELNALDRSADIRRGDRIGPGLLVETAVVVYLHGDCSLSAPSRKFVDGVALGWVQQLDGRIEPFANVDCTQVGNVLAVRARGVPQGLPRFELMSAALARVILHEWIHIATQQAGHARKGIEKAQFSAADLDLPKKGKPWPGIGERAGGK